MDNFIGFAADLFLNRQPQINRWLVLKPPAAISDLV